MKRKVFLSFSLVVLLSLSSTMLFAKPIELTMQTMGPDNHTITLALKEWAENVSKKSGEQIIIHTVANCAITQYPGSYTGLADGAVDIGAFTVNFAPKLHPYAQALSMPFLANTAVDLTKFIQKAMDTFPEINAELNNKDVVLLTMWGGADNCLLSTKGAVNSVSDLKGKRVLVWGGDAPSNEVKAWGGTPVQTTTPDTYVALQRGMGELAYFQFAPAAQLKLQEIAKNVSLFYVNGGPQFFGINKSVWESLAGNIQKIMQEEAANLGMEIAKRLEENNSTEAKNFAAAGINIINFSPEQISEFKTPLMTGEPMKYWVNILQKAGVADSQAWIDKVYALANNN